MKSKTHIVLTIVVVEILSLACGLFTIPSAPPTSISPAIQVGTATPPGTEPPSQPSVDTILPTGLATANDNLITFYNLDGTQVSQVALPQQTFPGRDRIHIAGRMPSNGAAVPLLYFTFVNGESLNFRDGNGQIFSLLSGTGFLGLTGVPGEAIVAFSEAEFLDTNLRTRIYAGSIQTLPSAAPISVMDDPESWAIKPILVETEGDAITKVWYTRIAYGIGGDIVFEPRKSLFALDLASGQVNTVLGNEVSPWAISNDQNWIAYGSNPVPPNSMCVKNLSSSAETCFPALPVSEPRGVGDAVISPDAQYVAWMEGEGWQMAEVPSFKATVRVGRNHGAIVADLPMNSFEDAADLGPLHWAEPVGWLDNKTVIVQVRGQEWNQTALLRHNVVSQESNYLAPGEFVGLVYP